MLFSTGKELIQYCHDKEVPISEAMLIREMNLSGASRADTFDKMASSWHVMKDAIFSALETPAPSMGGLIGGEAAKISNRFDSRPVCGLVMAKAISYAMGVLEINASMGLIVAAPTAGSSGVIPGAFYALQEEFSLTDEQMTQALFNASAIGYLVTRNATVAGAEGGCQAEVGTAASMAAAAIVELMGGTPAQCLSAASMALSNLLGLVCDPIAGLVEAPCQNRNAIGAANALICSEIALCGVTEKIPFDEMVDAMYQVGRRLPVELRETALGGIAATPTGWAICKKIFQ